MTRHGTDRILRYAFDLAQRRPARHLTSATKSNGIAITMPWWDSRVKGMAATYPQLPTDKYHINILAAQFVLNPDPFENRKRTLLNSSHYSATLIPSSAYKKKTN